MTHPVVKALIDKGFSVYPDVLGFNYFQDHPDASVINKYDYVFIHSDYGVPLKGVTTVQLLTGAEKKYPNTYSWCALDFNFGQLPTSEYTDIPTVGFVGRIPILTDVEGRHVLHRGFEHRYRAYHILESSENICFDGHARYEPLGDSAGFWNKSIPGFKRWEPLFKTNMLANQYALTARGNGNYAQRLYEAWSYGRIPVYVDSGGRMPFDHFVNYRDMDCFVWVDDINHIESDILTFHETHNLSMCQRLCNRIKTGCLSFKSQVRMFEKFHDEMNPYTGNTGSEV